MHTCDRWQVPFVKNRLLTVLIVGLIAANSAAANDWVYGNVQLIDDYSNYAGCNGNCEVLITLSNKVWTVPAHASSCTERFRIVVGLEGMTEEVKKRLFAMMLAAYTTGAKVRLFYNPATGPFCAVQLGSIGEP
jgi:hypothetical protein